MRLWLVGNHDSDTLVMVIRYHLMHLWIPENFGGDPREPKSGMTGTHSGGFPVFYYDRPAAADSIFWCIPGQPAVVTFFC